MELSELRRMLEATGLEITDDEGNVVGYVSQPARFRLDRSYLARGGFLVVSRDEETGQFIGAEYDALPHPKTGQPYPAGHSEAVWRVSSLQEALSLVLAYFEPETAQGRRLGREPHGGT